jgi:hypothetical protein
VPWLQPFPDRLLEDALLAATYAVAVTFLEISRALHRLDSHGPTIRPAPSCRASPSADTTCYRPLPQANDKFAYLAQAVCRPHSLSQPCVSARTAAA